MTLYLMMSVLSCFGIILACFFLIVNIKFRNQRSDSGVLSVFAYGSSSVVVVACSSVVSSSVAIAYSSVVLM